MLFNVNMQNSGNKVTEEVFMETLVKVIKILKKGVLRSKYEEGK